MFTDKVAAITTHSSWCEPIKVNVLITLYLKKN